MSAQTPNLFTFAVGELAQDSFICWLAKWADPTFREADPALHATGIAFVQRLLEVGNGPTVVEIKSIEPMRQEMKIDVLLKINGDTFVIIEDKTNTQEHSNQLKAYKSKVAQKFKTDKIAAVYFKTGDQGNYGSSGKSVPGG